jgi:hypothetical protein
MALETCTEQTGLSGPGAPRQMGGTWRRQAPPHAGRPEILSSGPRYRKESESRPPPAPPARCSRPVLPPPPSAPCAAVQPCPPRPGSRVLCSPGVVGGQDVGVLGTSSLLSYKSNCLPGSADLDDVLKPKFWTPGPNSRASMHQVGPSPLYAK